MIETHDVILKELAAIVGEKHVSTASDKIILYSKDQSFTPHCRPHYVVFPGNADEVQGIVKMAGEHGVPIVPRSSAVSLHGASIPTEGGILLDLQRMNRIIKIDKRNWHAIIEPGVTFLQLQKELQKHGFRVACPLLDPISGSVVSNYMERTPVTTAADFTYGAEHVICYTVIAPSGEPFTVGHPPMENTAASAPDGPGLNFYRIFQGAQGTLGIVTQLIIRVLPLPKAQKVFFFPCNSIDRAAEIIRRIQKSELGLECFALNDFNLAAMLLTETPDELASLKKGVYIGNDGAPPWAKEQGQQFSEIKKQLPPWTVVLCLSAAGPLPQEKIDYQELDLTEATAEIGAEPTPTVGGIPALDKVILEEILLPWRMQKRFGYRGSCHSLMFCSAPDQVGRHHTTVATGSQMFDYSMEDVGIYLLPMERARAFYCTYDLHCSLADLEESARVEGLFHHLSETLVDSGAFFDRPYGRLAELVYSRAGNYTDYLKRLKHSLDPNRIMNPGKLCL